MAGLSDTVTAFVVFVSTAIILSVLTNIITIITVITTTRLRKNVTYIFISTLAAFDVLFGAVVLPQNVHDVTHVESSWYEGKFIIYTIR